MIAGAAVIGYYVHHHGDGHASRFRAIAAASEHRIVPISERCDLDDGLVLPSDVPAHGVTDPTAGGALHWAPLDPSSAAPRLRILLDWLDRVRPVGVVVDVSVEIALACRLAGFRTIYVRQHGARGDRPHRAAYAAATGLLAPYPPALEAERCADVLRKTRHVGFVHPAARVPSVPRDGFGGGVHARPTSADAVVLWGRGGGHLSSSFVDAIADAIDGSVYCAGREIWGAADRPQHPNVVELGWVADVAALLHERPVVVSSAGRGCVAAAARFRCPLVVVPLERPFDEQHDHAAALARAGVAVLAPPTACPTRWRDAVVAARAAAATWERLSPDDDGAHAAAAAISEWLLA